jgi:hypothetical protein
VGAVQYVNMGAENPYAQIAWKIVCVYIRNEHLNVVDVVAQDLEKTSINMADYLHSVIILENLKLRMMVEMHTLITRR